MRYLINNRDISEDFGVVVQSDEGLADHLAMKDIETVDNPGQHGQEIDLTTVRYSHRTITLKCWFRSYSPVELERSVAHFRAFLLQQQLLRLEISHKGLSLHYDAYCPNGFKVTKQWRDHKMINQFTLTLIEPQPIKRVYHCRDTVAKLSIQSDQPLQVGLGDGVVLKHVFEREIEHTYQDGVEIHHVIVAGVFAPETVINTNMTLICSVSS